MSNIIEAMTRQKELERVAALNKAAAAGEKQLAAETSELMDKLARREQQRKLADAKRQVETELYRAEQSIRAKSGGGCCVICLQKPCARIRDHKSPPEPTLQLHFREKYS